MKKRNDPPGYPGDDRITQWYNELKEMVREERGLSEAEHVIAKYLRGRGSQVCSDPQGDWHSVPCHARGAQIDSPGAGRAVKRTGEGEFGRIERGTSDFLSRRHNETVHRFRSVRLRR
jgi:hypothetical protein